MSDVVAVAPVHDIVYDGVIIRTYHVNRGEGLPRHQHFYAHLTQCHSGSCLIKKDGKEKVITKFDAPVNLLPSEWHEIVALEDSTVIVNTFAEGRAL